MYYKEQLISIRESLSDLLSDLKKEKEALPEGSLYVDQKGGKNYTVSYLTAHDESMTVKSVMHFHC